MIESQAWFIPRILEIGSEQWIPSVDDVLHCRIRTTGICETRFEAHGHRFNVLLTGGQRNERRKWVQCFHDVDVVFFVVSLSDFDKRLFEDDSTNRVLEAVDVFDMVCNAQWFARSQTRLVLVFNMIDLFREKIERVNLGDMSEFADYRGQPYSFEDGMQYFNDLFMHRNRNPHKAVHHSLTTATDSEAMKTTINTR